MSHPIPLPAPADTAAAVLDGHGVHASVPLGAVLRYFDGTPQPPALFHRKLSAWKSRNGTGRLVEKSPPETIGDRVHPATFTTHQGDHASNGIILMTVRSVYRVTTDRRFEVIERPRPGMVRVLQRWNARDELKYLAADLADAERWIARNRSTGLVTETVGADEIPTVIGRAA